jgi:hypothetical protein
MDKLIYTKFCMLTSQQQEEILERQELQKKCILSLSPGEVGCCSLETACERRKVPRAKLLVSDSRSQKQRLQPDKLTWV